MQAYFSLIILIVVLVTIAIRQALPIKIAIWQAMLFGALAVLITGSIPISGKRGAISAVMQNWDVLSFLFGAFVIAEGLDISGCLDKILCKLFGTMQSGFLILFILMLLSAIGSAILMNDTIAIIGVPVILYLANKSKNNNKMLYPLFFGLAISVTIGSNLSPIGNPQNLLIATSALSKPFVNFIDHLWLPSLINLIIAYIYLCLIYKKLLTEGFRIKKTSNTAHNKINKTYDFLGFLSKSSCILLFLLIILSVILANNKVSHILPFGLLSLIACLPILIFSRHRLYVLKKVDWQTLIFFISLFVLIASVWNGGVLYLWAQRYREYLLHLPSLMGVSILASQVISNVPLVALYLKVLSLPTHDGSLVSNNLYMALAASSTIAGNLSVMGAASNVIIVHRLEKTSSFVLGCGRFFIVGTPLVLVNILVYYLFLK